MARQPTQQDIEVYPEPDRLDGYPHPRETVQLYGQDAAEQTLMDAFGSGRMHHGWILAGPPGIGKATLAYRFVKFMLAEREERDPFGQSLAVSPDTTAARQVSSQSHPGLFVLRRPYDLKAKRLRTEITVDEARRLKHFLSLTAEEGAWRAVVVDSADELNIAAGNALLKSLEEPPARTAFLLVSSRPGSLLATIRSRCRMLEMPALDEGALRKAVTQAIAASGESATAHLPHGKDWSELAHLSGGSVRRFLALHGGGGHELHRQVMALMGDLPRVDWGAVHGLADTISSPASESRFELFVDLLLSVVARLIRAGATGSGEREELELARRLVPEERTASWARLWEELVALKADTNALNLDRKGLILGIFSRLQTVATGIRAA